MENSRYTVKEVVKFGMFFGYVIYDSQEKTNTAHEYSEDEKHLAESKCERLNLLD